MRSRTTGRAGGSRGPACSRAGLPSRRGGAPAPPPGSAIAVLLRSAPMNPSFRDRAPGSNPFPPFEFHVTRAARERYELDDTWFGLSGNAILADFAATRRLAHRMNQVRD